MTLQRQAMRACLPARQPSSPPARLPARLPTSCQLRTAPTRPPPRRSAPAAHRLLRASRPCCLRSASRSWAACSWRRTCACWLVSAGGSAAAALGRGGSTCQWSRAVARGRGSTCPAPLARSSTVSARQPSSPAAPPRRNTSHTAPPPAPPPPPRPGRRPVRRDRPHRARQVCAAQPDGHAADARIGGCCVGTGAGGLRERRAWGLLELCAAAKSILKQAGGHAL